MASGNPTEHISKKNIISDKPRKICHFSGLPFPCCSRSIWSLFLPRKPTENPSTSSLDRVSSRRSPSSSCVTQRCFDVECGCQCGDHLPSSPTTQWATKNTHENKIVSPPDCFPRRFHFLFRALLRLRPKEIASTVRCERLRTPSFNHNVQTTG